MIYSEYDEKLRTCYPPTHQYGLNCHLSIEMQNSSNYFYSTISTFVILAIFSVFGKAQKDVLKISNVDFPSTGHHPASFDATYHKEISEFTICIRFLIDSYNNNLFPLVRAENTEPLYFLDRIGWETGMERDGYQDGILVIIRNIPGGGVGGLGVPWYRHYNIPKNIATSKEGYQNKKEHYKNSELEIL